MMHQQLGQNVPRLACPEFIEVFSANGSLLTFQRDIRKYWRCVQTFCGLRISPALDFFYWERHLSSNIRHSRVRRESKVS